MQVRNMVLCGLFAALMCICAWISIPFGDIAFTLQTFSLFLSLQLLGGKKGSIICLLYLLLGTVGLPVFSGFRGGIGGLMGVTGGYITGFLACALVYWLVTALLGDGLLWRIAGSLLGLLALYASGTTWYVFFYLDSANALGIGAVLLKCVVPFLFPDAIKLALATLLASRLRRHLRS